MTTIGRRIILYDGVCGLCNGFVRFVIRHDPQGIFHFATLQSDFSHQLLSRYSHDIVPNPQTMTTVIMVNEEDQSLLIKSDAALAILRELRQPWSMLGVFSFIPKSLRDAVYDAIASRRYRIFGKYDVCPVMKPEWRERFLSPVS